MPDTRKRMQTIAWFRDHCEWLHEDAHIDVELARGVVRASAVWFQKSAGPVAVPGQAMHVTWGPYGWRIYSSNSFEITLFVEAARKIILSAYKDAIDGTAPKAKNLAVRIAWRAHECVSGFDDSLYGHYGHGRFLLAFGSHAIMALNAAQYLLDESDYKTALVRASQTPRPNAQAQPRQRSRAPRSPQQSKTKAPARKNSQSKHAKIAKQRELFVESGLARAREAPRGFNDHQAARLTELLTRIAALEIPRSGAATDEAELDRLWAQALPLIKPGLPLNTRDDAPD